MTRPTELALTLASLPGHRNTEDGWMTADEVLFRLKMLGFAATTQQVAAWLGRMARTDQPWVERRRRYDGWPMEYRVTGFGECDLLNKFPGVRVIAPWLSTPITTSRSSHA